MIMSLVQDGCDLICRTRSLKLVEYVCDLIVNTVLSMTYCFMHRKNRLLELTQMRRMMKRMITCFPCS